VILADGSKYDGYWLMNEFTRFGTIFYADGRKFSGTFRKGKKHGFGTLVSATGEVLEGSWSGDKLQDTFGVIRCGVPQSSSVLRVWLMQ